MISFISNKIVGKLFCSKYTCEWRLGFDL